MERRHWLWLAAALIAATALATAVQYDVGGYFSAPGLQQE